MNHLPNSDLYRKPVSKAEFTTVYSIALFLAFIFTAGTKLYFNETVVTLSKDCESMEVTVDRSLPVACAKTFKKEGVRTILYFFNP